jgi:hypothetical protein
LAKSGVLLQLEAELTGPLADSTTIISLMYSIASILPQSHPDHLRQILLYPQSQLQKILNEFISSPNNAERMCAFKVIGQLSSGASSDSVIGQFLQRNWKIFEQIIYALSDIDVEVVNTALDSIHSILKGWESNPYMESESGQNTLANAIAQTFKRHPFPECRCLIYAVLGAMILDEELTRSALAVIVAEPSPIRAALLDYKSEPTYDCRRAKCDFVRILVKTEDKGVLSKFFNKEQVENFIDFAEQGLEWAPITTGKDEMETEPL